MAKMPIRIDSALLDSATIVGTLMHRTPPEQLEYWATIGRMVERQLDPRTLLDIKAGVAQITIQPVETQVLDSDSIFDSLTRLRVHGDLASQVTTTKVRYQASRQYPGYLEQLSADGTVEIGTFENQQFKKRSPQS